jgi:uncharacterized membrane protein
MRIRALLITCVTVITAVVAATPAAAQPNQRGLVNVAITDTTVQVPIGIAANVCGVAVNVLATAANFGDVDCTAEGVAIAENGGGGGGNGPTQRGLINLAITNTTIQIPVAVAANVCGVAVNVLARGLNTGDVNCTAEGVARAFR